MGNSPDAGPCPSSLQGQWPGHEEVHIGQPLRWDCSPFQDNSLLPNLLVHLVGRHSLRLYPGPGTVPDSGEQHRSLSLPAVCPLA